MPEGWIGRVPVEKTPGGRGPWAFAILWRYLAESNCCARFCRPMPNHSAKVPCFAVSGAKVGLIFELCKFFGRYFAAMLKTINGSSRLFTALHGSSRLFHLKILVSGKCVYSAILSDFMH